MLKMGNSVITADVKMDAGIFRRFTVYDYLCRQRRWIPLASCAAIMSGFACVCFVMRNSENQAVMLGCLLLIIGWGLPAFHIWSLFKSIKAQAKIYKLDKPQPVYSLRLSKDTDGVRVSNPGGEAANFEWANIYRVYRAKECTYMYVAKNKAFILPDAQVAEGADTLWKLFADMLPEEKLCGRKIKRT